MHFNIHEKGQVEEIKDVSQLRHYKWDKTFCLLEIDLHQTT